MLSWEDYKQIRCKYFGEKRSEARIKFRTEYKPAMEKKMNCEDCCSNAPPKTAWAEPRFGFAPLPKAVPAESFAQQYYEGCAKEPANKKGKPMRYNDNTAVASVSIQKSDAAAQREYFLNRLENAKYPKLAAYEKQFDLHVTPGPKNFEELIDMIKNDKFKINKKAQEKLDDNKEQTTEENQPYWVYGVLYGFDWDGPKADWKGYEKVTADLDKAQMSARDTIMSGDAAAMAKAVADFEAWTPVGKSN